MEHLIQFKQSVYTLNDQEFHLLISNIGKTTIIDSIFNYFLNQLQNVNTMNVLNNVLIPRIKHINHNIKTIILSRKEEIDIADNNKTEQQIPMQLQDLPDIIISNISSFLTIQETIRFERCSRLTFIAARSPISVQEMKHNEFIQCMQLSNENNSIYNWHRLKSLKMISINTHHCIYPKWGNLSSLFKNIEILHLNCLNDKDIKDIHHTTFLQQFKMCSFQNVKKFELINIDGSDDEIHFDGAFLDGLISVINKHKKLEYLSLYWGENGNRNNVFPNILFSKYEWISQLKGIAVCNAYDADNEAALLTNICPNIGDNLLSFHTANGCGQLTSDVDGKFDELKEICIPWPSPKSDIDFLLKQNLKHLERINFGSYGLGEDWDATSDKFVFYAGYLLKKIIESVDYISIDLENSDINVVDVLDALIDMMQNVRKCHLCLSIDNMMDNIHNIIYHYNVHDIAEKLLKLINILSTNCDHFKIKCEHIKSDELLHKIQDKFCIQSQRDDEMKHIYRFEISNHNYIGNESTKQWILSCNRCGDW